MDGTGALAFRQYYLGCLSQASYLIGDRTTGRAVVVDPQRDVGAYLADAREHGLRIERVLETHVHADFVSGHLELAAATGARIAYGSAAQVEFDIDRLAHGERISLGEVELEIRHTPGHTPESICIVVRAAAGDEVPFGVLTGDTLFIGDVGRPDLLGAGGWSADDLGRALFRSTREQLLTLPDATRVFPAHGAGSACGKNLSTETSSTVGEQRRTNYALAPMTEDAFVAAVCEGQSTAPAYFAYASVRNRQQRPTLDQTRPVPALTATEVLAAQSGGAALLDTRDPQDFAAGHVRGSVNVGLGGRFAEMVGEVLSADVDLVLVGDPGTEVEARNRLARIGFDRVLGYLACGAAGVPGEHLTPASRLTAAQVTAAPAGVRLVDVRGPGEVRAGGTVPGAALVPLPELVARLGQLDPARPTVVFCAGGYRSSIAASTLRARGFADVSDLIGGFAAWDDGVRPVQRTTPA
ncbi:MBL fold metallo-hydrolase [Pseudonocardia hydrocarbonoxydans]|uniref:MBL fold hydrolase n=1 Tax=Pseudonocardia hydrocarbonoxydans TaxID=76726 RepID=A0A4Y3WML7_9PSEU|nr:MBL fold metallo-hydrolase [Pseudonocardia hydrocarbonoxydans]GEC20103.1 MBL fold hydrolase [Pseudonocardia hydrocarbonoxydans]